MPDHAASGETDEPLHERLRAVERALTDADDDLTDLRAAAELARDLDALADRLDDAEDRLDELDAATQALRGYVGNVRAVNRSVEQTANAALAKAEGVESERTAADERRVAPGRSRERAPCGCARRRSGEPSRPEEPTRPEQSAERGLLGRLASSLASALTGDRTESR